MTKLPSGRPSFPQHPTGVVQLVLGKNYRHALRWLLVRQKRDMSPDQTWDETFQAVADIEAASKRKVAWQTIEGTESAKGRSAERVESAKKAGKANKFFISDWPPDMIPDTALRGAKKTPRF